MTDDANKSIEVVLIFFLILCFQYPNFFEELVSAAEKPQCNGGVTSFEQDPLLQFGSQAEPIKQQIHRMFLLRMKLMHFVNSLHNYIMTRVCIAIIT